MRLCWVCPCASAPVFRLFSPSARELRIVTRQQWTATNGPKINPGCGSDAKIDAAPARMPARAPATKRALGRRYSFLGGSAHRRALGISRDDGLQGWSSPPFEALVVVHVADGADQIHVHNRELAGSETVRGAILLEPVQAVVDAIALAPQISDLIGLEPTRFDEKALCHRNKSHVECKSR
jgi:hypothetical protein